MGKQAIHFHNLKHVTMFAVKQHGPQQYIVGCQGSSFVILFKVCHENIQAVCSYADISDEEPGNSIIHGGTPLFPRFSDPNFVFCSTIQECGSPEYIEKLAKQFQNYSFNSSMQDNLYCSYTGMHVRGEGMLYLEDAEKICAIYLEAEEMVKNQNSNDSKEVIEMIGSHKEICLLKSALKYYLS